MGLLQIRRKPAWYGRFRTLRVFVDGVHVGGVSARTAGRFELYPGVHSVYVKLDWVTSPSVSIEVPEDGVVMLEAVIPTGPFAALTAMIEHSPFRLREIEAS